MGSVPIDLSGVGSATNSTALQIGSALGVAVLGSLLNTRYQADIASLLSHYSVPQAIAKTTEGSLGGALEVATRIGGNLGVQLSETARQSFISGMTFAVTVGAIISGTAACVVVALLPSRAPKR